MFNSTYLLPEGVSSAPEIVGVDGMSLWTDGSNAVALSKSSRINFWAPGVASESK